jgi:hypothetical protein
LFDIAQAWSAVKLFHFPIADQAMRNLVEMIAWERSQVNKKQ